MRNLYQKQKWWLWEKLEQLNRFMGDKPTKQEKEKKARLLKQFNNKLPHHRGSRMYSGCEHGVLQACPNCYDSTE